MANDLIICQIDNYFIYNHLQSHLPENPLWEPKLE
jgi:hypothetical protein